MIIDDSIKVLAKEAIDKRLLLTKDQMLSVGESDLMPDRYLAICSDSDKSELYLFDKDNEWSSEGSNLGKFRLLKENDLTVGEGLSYSDDGQLSLKLGDRLTVDPEGNIVLANVPEAFTVDNGLSMTGNVIGVDYDDDTIKVNADGKLYANVEGLNLHAKLPVKLSNDEISLLYDNSTIKVKSTGKLYVPLDGITLKVVNGKLCVPIDKNTIYLEGGVLKSKGAEPDGTSIVLDENNKLSVKTDDTTILKSDKGISTYERIELRESLAFGGRFLVDDMTGERMTYKKLFEALSSPGVSIVFKYTREDEGYALQSSNIKVVRYSSGINPYAAKISDPFTGSDFTYSADDETSPLMGIV